MQKSLRFVVLLCCLITSIVSVTAQDELTPHEIALQRIEQARATDAVVLDLGGLALTELPPEIGQLHELQGLNLGYNNLESLPLEIWQLSNLRGLGLSDNQLTSLPAEIGALSNLQYFDVLGNQLVTLPPEIGQLSQLLVLDVSSNHLTSLPPQIGQLVQLQELYLRGNQLKELPSEIGQLSNLRTLDLEQNQLATLPPEVRNLQNLYQLNLMNNHFQRLPFELGYLTNLIPNGEMVCFEDGQCRVPFIIFDSNPLRWPPNEILTQDTETMLAYMRNEAWYHLQRLIIGAAVGVGLLAVLILGVRLRLCGNRKEKRKRDV